MTAGPGGEVTELLARLRMRRRAGGCCYLTWWTVWPVLESVQRWPQTSLPAPQVVEQAERGPGRQ